jgi:hypothetical protein
MEIVLALAAIVGISLIAVTAPRATPPSAAPPESGFDWQLPNGNGYGPSSGARRGRGG